MKWLLNLVMEVLDEESLVFNFVSNDAFSHHSECRGG